MTIEEQIERAFHEWWNAPEPTDGRTVDISEFIMPLVKRAQAEAWHQGYDTGYDDRVFEDRGMPSDPDAHEYPHHNPYIEKRA